MVEAPRATRRPYVAPRVTLPSAQRLAPAGGGTGSKGKMGGYDGPS
jgi:hypothetical protein